MNPNQSSSEDEFVDPLSAHIDTLTAIHMRAEREVSRHQRAVESVTAWLGRPQFFYGIVVGAGLWMLFNSLAARLRLPQWDSPPFYWLQGAVGLGSLLMTTVVLITQNRQAKVIQRQAQLDLQVSLMGDQKAAKIIELLEELRRDMPGVHNRVDAEAEMLQETVDPHVVLTALEFKLEQAMESAVELEQAAARTEATVSKAIQETQRSLQEESGSKKNETP